MALEAFEDVLKSIQKNKGRPFHLLLGNGFSVAYDPDIFSYTALHSFVAKLDNKLLNTLFEIIKTRNFELVLEQLTTFSALLEAFGSEKRLQAEVIEATGLLKNRLVDAIQGMHPQHVFKVPQQSIDACARFLAHFLDTGGNLFTTNYDLLLYWVLMRSNIKPGDGFGRDLLNEDEVMKGEEPETSDLRWGRNKDRQRVFYVHGALPIFDTGAEIIKEEYDGEHYLMDRVRSRIESGQYPVFVAAGDGTQKLAHIKHNAYLGHCYESLASVSGSIVTFGFGFGPYDEHVIDALNRATKPRRDLKDKLWSIYIGVYSQDGYDHALTVESKLKCKVRIYDARSVEVWGTAGGA